MKSHNPVVFNMDYGSVKLKFDDSSMISIICTAVENEVVYNMYRYSKLDCLICNGLWRILT